MTAFALRRAHADDSSSSRRLRGLTAGASITLLATFLVSVFLLPLLYMTSTALKDGRQIPQVGAPLWPASPATFIHEGREFPVYKVPTDTGVRELALIEPGREESTFVDPAQPEIGPIEWIGRWRTLEQSWRFEPQIQNFGAVWDLIDFPRLFGNTLIIAVLGTIGAVASAVAVAYGFSRFRIPGKSFLFILLISTIILPFQVTLIPSYVVFTAIGWTGTWLPLIVPHFFANAYNVFLLRQYFMTIPRDLDEAAMMDGASPLQTLLRVIVPQSIPAITAVALFHFFFAWNDFFTPLVYLSGSPELQPISVGIQRFNATYAEQPQLIQAAALMALALPALLFFFAQRAFMRGVVVTGVEK